MLAVRPEAWVIDAGLFTAFQETQPPPQAVPGKWVAGEIYLGIDPFFYFERLHALEGIPPLSYRWMVRALERETTPWVEARHAGVGRKVRQRDERRESFVPISVTDAWHDDGGDGHYLLGCERIGGPERP